MQLRTSECKGSHVLPCLNIQAGVKHKASLPLGKDAVNKADTWTAHLKYPVMQLL